MLGLTKELLLIWSKMQTIYYQQKLLNLQDYLTLDMAEGEEDLPATLIAMNQLMNKNAINLASLAKTIDEILATGNKKVDFLKN